jgi:pimeloyl-ACP methyl ester carboxylesterase
MELLTKLRDSGRLYQIGVALSVLLGFFLLVLLLTSGMILYQAIYPSGARATLGPDSLMSRPSVVTFYSNGSAREGWFFPGLRAAPTILLAHGYQSNKEEVLTLATALQEHRYNVFMFDFSGHGQSDGFSGLGYKEADEIVGAIQALVARDDLDRERFGVWGQTLGGYAAVAAAAREPRIRAVAADSVYDSPESLFRLQSDQSALNIIGLSATIARWSFLVLNFGHRGQQPLSEQVKQLSNIPKLFVQGNDNRAFADFTVQLFFSAPEPKSQAVVTKSRYAFMLDDEKRAYDNTIVQFFLQNLPPVPQSRN